MHTHTVHKPEITLSGVSVRTTNTEEAGPNGRLPQLWESYFQKNIASGSGVVNPHLIYALYTDYESDATGEYTAIIGHEVGNAAVREDSDLAGAVIPESKYKVFTTRKGPVYEVVAEAWGVIWQYFKDSPEIRAYTGDFELYDARTFDPANTEVQIYIAVH